ncbi:MAG: carbon-nitrogen hydrolase family protein [Candidatus Thermoplasmatota archaeon]|nr:carbon-nitrogen hydrolase family protein [Candidatus Thermoplasmatota archaeon]
MTAMKIGLLQLSRTLCTDGLQDMERALKKDMDLLLLPEKWMPIRGENVVRDDRHPFLDEVSSLSKNYGTAIITGALYESFEDEMFITSYAYGADGELLAKQRKMHLFGSEAQSFRPGYEINYFDYLDSRIGMAICYDIDFPETVRKFALSGCDVLAVPAKIRWEGMEPWMTYVRARALENRLPIAFANCSEGPFFRGGSAVVDLRHDGKTGIVYPSVMEIGDESHAVFEIDPSKIREERERRLSERNLAIDAFAWEEGGGRG